MLKQKIKTGVEKSKKWASEHRTEIAVIGYGLACFGYGCIITCVIHKAKETLIKNGIYRMNRDGFLTMTKPGGCGLLVKIDDVNEWVKVVRDYYNLK